MIDSAIQNNLIEHFLFSFFFFLGFLITSYFSRIKGFISLPMKRYTGAYCLGKDVLINLLFFILSFSFLGPIFYNYLPFIASSSVFKMTLVPVVSLIFNLILITLYSFTNKTFHVLNLIKDKMFPLKLNIFQDILAGWKTLILSFFPFLLQCYSSKVSLS